MVTYITFIEKYPQHENLEIERFEFFLADALPEINLYNWGNLKNRATELLLLHLIAIASDVQGSMPLKSLKVDDEGYDVAYSELKGNYDLTIWGKEYQRLLNVANNTTNKPSSIPTKGAHFHGVRGEIKRILPDIRDYNGRY